jgi:AcrR family transcriptional regulator
MSPMPRRSAAAVAETRADVLDVAVRRASIDGLEGLTIGQLADEVAMSKSGLHGLFGSKEELQLAVFETAVASFTREVWQPVARREPGLPRLLALLDRWLSYHRRRTLPGGCLVTTATIEFDARPGPLRDAVLRARRQIDAVLQADVRTAVEAGDLPADANPADLAFTLYALASAASQAIQLEEPGAAARARRAMRTLLGTR